MRHSLFPHWLRVLETWALPICCVGVLIFAIRLLRSSGHIAKLRRSGEPVDSAFAEIAAGMSNRMGIARPARVLLSALADGPSVVGWLRPVILFPPAALMNLSPSQLEAVLAHELAHIRRQDYLVNLLQTIAETLFFYQPGIWWVSSRIRYERELCCDDIVVERRPQARRSIPYLGVAAWTQTADTRPWVVRAMTGPERAQLVSLPESKREIETAARLLPRPDKLLLGDTATRTNFLKLPLERYDVLHLSLHGYADMEFPDRSALVFAPAPQLNDSGFLQAREIRQLHLNARLVTLSGCKTSVGPVYGTGTASVVNAFIEAGAPERNLYTLGC
jgi:hypothetical protein